MTIPRARPGQGSAEWVATPKPAVLVALPEAREVRLDVREDIRAGREPFGRIMGALNGLAPDAALVVRAPFEPVPLYGVLGRRGLGHWTERLGPDDWAVWFYRPTPGAEAASPPPQAATAPPATDAVIRLDVRGLEPPLPMVRILECLDSLAPGQRLEVVHDRPPLFLYPQLDDRGFAHETTALEPGLVRIVIRREAAGP